METKKATQSGSWSRVSRSFGILEADVRRYLDEISVEAAADRVAFEKSVRALLSAFEDSVGAAGKLVRHPGLRQDLADTASAVRDAFVSTFQAPGQQVRPSRVETAPRARRASAGPTATTRKTAAKNTSKAAPAKDPARKASKATAAKSTSRKSAS